MWLMGPPMADANSLLAPRARRSGKCCARSGRCANGIRVYVAAMAVSMKPREFDGGGAGFSTTPASACRSREDALAKGDDDLCGLALSGDLPTWRLHGAGALGALRRNRLIQMVAGVGIEPTTRGFSIRCSTN